MLRKAIIPLFLVSLWLLIGCGSVSNNTRPAPTPTPTPSPVPSPSPNPTPATASDSFLSTWFFTVGRNPAPVGTITLDNTANNGAGNMQASVASNNSTFILQFCPYPQNFSNCMNVTAITSDANGSVNANFVFPAKGTFSGAFQVVDANGTQSQAAGNGSSGVSFKSALLPAATITGGINQTTGNSPGFGSAAVTGTTAHITLTGALPNHTFNTALCSLSVGPCDILGNVTTDAQGNANADVGAVIGNSFNVFRLSDASGVQFVSAFRVQ